MAGWSNRLAVFVVTLDLLLLRVPRVLSGQAPASPLPLRIEEEHSAKHRWLGKIVLESRVLDDMEETGPWSHHGPGSISLTTQRSRTGQHSLRLLSPTRTGRPGDVPGRPFAEAVARRQFSGEDWTGFNRLSFWVYPHLPGFHVISMLVKLRNEGVVKVPDDYGREGLNYFLLEPDEWNHVVWEIPHLARDKVTAVDFIYRLQGEEPGAAATVQFDIDALELQRVAADTFEGWGVAPGSIAYSHSGYVPGGRKTALAGGLPAREFKLVNARTRKAELTREIRTVRSPLGEFQSLDFSDVLQQGRYYLEAGAVKTPAFDISHNAWRESILKVINFFSCERCGAVVPGIHGVCHRDWTARHNGRSLFINGGWHDAGDLSQGLANTAEAVYAMFRLAERLRDEDPALADRLLEEARWGLAWIHKTRFGDGTRVTWATMDYWTDGALGTADDTFGEAEDNPLDNFLAATAEAIAGRVLRDSDPRLAEKSLKLAREDWGFAVAKVKQPGAELASIGVLASLELFKATEELAFAREAFDLADVIVRSQQREWTQWTVPMNGFYYTDPSHKEILRYFHRSHEQAPTVALAGLCEEFPEHADWMKWYTAVALYSEYLKTVARFTGPYDMLPASVYRVDESADPGFRRQVMEGIKLDETHYLRRFPVWQEFRGNSGVLLSQTKALSAAARLRGSPELADLVQDQLQWHVGRNPFCQSLMFGEGHDYAPQYTAMSGDMAGSLPVGIQTRGDRDLPYWPAANCYNYKEVWVHPAARWLWIMCEAAGAAQVSGAVEPHSVLSVDFEESRTHQRFIVKPDRRTGRFAARLPAGQYVAQQGDRDRTVTLLPGRRCEVNLRELFEFTPSAETAPDGSITITIQTEQEGPHRLAVRTQNLTVRESEQTVESKFGQSKTRKWHARKISPAEPWLVVIIPDGNLDERKELVEARH